MEHRVRMSKKFASKSINNPSFVWSSPAPCSTEGQIDRSTSEFIIASWVSKNSPNQVSSLSSNMHTCHSSMTSKISSGTSIIQEGGEQIWTLSASSDYGFCISASCCTYTKCKTWNDGLFNSSQHSRRLYIFFLFKLIRQTPMQRGQEIDQRQPNKRWLSVADSVNPGGSSAPFPPSQLSINRGPFWDFVENLLSPIRTRWSITIYGNLSP